MRPAADTHLHIAAFDLARGPDGHWWVVSQRTQAPSGLGYLLENRLVTSRLFPEAFSPAAPQPPVDPEQPAATEAAWSPAITDALQAPAEPEPVVPAKAKAGSAEERAARKTLARIDKPSISSRANWCCSRRAIG